MWAARFYKTRGVAQDAIEKGRVTVAGERIKPARAVRVGDLLQLDQGDWEREVCVLALSESRGPASLAQQLYADTPASLLARDKARERRALFQEPAQAIKGRPSKRDRRDLDKIGRD